jgi:hypothetical protein
MLELSSEARSLVSDGRGALRPTARDRARVASRLTTRLGAAALLTAQPGFAATKAPLISKLSSVVAALGLVGAGATYSFLSTPEVALRAPAPVRAAALAPVAPAPEAPLDTVPAPSEAQPPPVKSEPGPPVSRKSVVTDGLGEEVALLSRATSQLRGGDAAGALAVLEQHQRQFPAGRLWQERLAARAQALCSLGRNGEAEAELSRLERRAPRSPHVARARRACGL